MTDMNNFDEVQKARGRQLEKTMSGRRVAPSQVSWPEGGVVREVKLTVAQDAEVSRLMEAGVSETQAIACAVREVE